MGGKEASREECERPFCPFMLPSECIGESCALFLEEEGECAIVYIARYLLANDTASEGRAA